MKRKITLLFLFLLIINWFINPLTVPNNKYLLYKDKKTEPSYFLHHKLYMQGGPYSEGFTVMRDWQRKYGCFDDRGKTVIPFQYDNMRRYNEGLCAVELNGKWGYINKQNEVVIPFIYDSGYLS